MCAWKLRTFFKNRSNNHAQVSILSLSWKWAFFCNVWMHLLLIFGHLCLKGFALISIYSASQSKLVLSEYFTWERTVSAGYLYFLRQMRNSLSCGWAGILTFKVLSAGRWNIVGPLIYVIMKVLEKLAASRRIFFLNAGTIFLREAGSLTTCMYVHSPTYMIEVYIKVSTVLYPA